MAPWVLADPASIQPWDRPWATKGQAHVEGSRGADGTSYLPLPRSAGQPANGCRAVKAASRQGIYSFLARTARPCDLIGLPRCRPEVLS